MGVNLVISFKVKPERLASFTDLMKTVKATLPTVPGCRGVTVLQDLENPLAFTLVETWDSKEVHGKHVKGMQDSGQWKAMTANFSADPVSSYYQQL